MKGKAPAHVDPSYYNKHKEPVIYDDTSDCNGMRFQLRIKALLKNGTVAADTSGIHVRDATEVILFLSAATSFNEYDKCPDKDGKDENKLALEYLEKAIKKPFQVLLENHLADFHKYFNRVSFSLADTSGSNKASVASDKRFRLYSDGTYDPGIETLYFQ